MISTACEEVFLQKCPLCNFVNLICSVPSVMKNSRNVTQKSITQWKKYNASVPSHNTMFVWVFFFFCNYKCLFCNTMVTSMVLVHDTISKPQFVKQRWHPGLWRSDGVSIRNEVDQFIGLGLHRCVTGRDGVIVLWLKCNGCIPIQSVCDFTFSQ